MLGLMLATIGFVRVSFLGRPIAPASRTATASTTCWSRLTVSAVLVGVVLFGALIGAMLPFVLRRLNFDPATASAPFVATLVDVTGLVIYFTVASLILQGSLL